MSKIFKATCKSFKGQHPAGLVIHDVYVTDKFAKDAVEKAKEELKFWDPEHFDKYQAPKVVAVKENAETELETYLLKKENHGQEEINEQPGEAELPTNTTNLFDEPSATVAEFAIAYPYVVRVAIALSKGSFLSSYSILNSEDNAVAVGFIGSFNPKSFKEIDNAIVFAISLAVDALNDTMADILGSELESSVQMLKNYASDAESEFIDNYVEDIDLQSAKITEAVAEVEKLTTSNKTDEISIIADAVICHRDYKNCADPHEPDEFIGQVKANFKEIFDEYGQLPGKQIAEHIKSLSEVRDLYNLGPCEEIAGFYITPQGNELSKAAKDALDKTVVASQENADKDWPKGEYVGYDSSNEWQRLAFSILSKTNEAGEPTPQQYKEMAAKLCGVFAEKGLELMSGEFYSEVATQLITHAINADSVFSTLLNLRELRALISEIVKTIKGKTEHGLKPNHDIENEYECFIADILSRLQTDGANYLTSAQYEEAGDKLKYVINEFVDWYDGEREHDGKVYMFIKDVTLENVRNSEFDDANECAKIFLNIRSLRARIRENVELIETAENASNDVEKPEVVSLKEMPNPHAFTEDTDTTIKTWPYLNLLSLDIGDSLTAHISIGRSIVDKSIQHNSFIGVIENRNGVFYAIKKSLDKPNVNNQLTNAVHGALSELERIIDCKFSSAKDAIHTLSTWRANLVGDQWFMQHSSSFKVKATTSEQVVNNEPKQTKTLPDESKSLPEQPNSQDDRPDSSGNTAANDSDNHNTKSAGKAVKNASHEKSNAPSVDSDLERGCGGTAGTPVLDSDEDNGSSVDISELDIPCVDLDESNSNMSIWNRAFKTDLAFTKRDTSSGLLSINPQYRGMKATEIFGSEGKGWGVNVIERWIEEGMPIFINGQPTGICESTQHIEIELWYIHPDDGHRYTITSFGETERFYWSHNYGRLIKNTDCYKKSLTDATGKALSKLGICGDVYMGEYDDEHIDTLSHNVKEANKKVRQLEEEEKIRTEVNEQVAEIIEEMQETTTKSGVNTLRAKALHIVSGLPDISDEQKRKKSSVIQKLEVRYNERLQEIIAEQKRKKQEKTEKIKQPDKEVTETEKQEA
ncbi:hypothetical protein ACJ7RV_002180 [Vibrio parahaemolyticus]